MMINNTLSRYVYVTFVVSPEMFMIYIGSIDFYFNISIQIVILLSLYHYIDINRVRWRWYFQTRRGISDIGASRSVSSHGMVGLPSCTVYTVSMFICFCLAFVYLIL